MTLETALLALLMADPPAEMAGPPAEMVEGAPTPDSEPLTPATAEVMLALTPDMDPVIPTDWERDERAPASMIELEAEGALMVVDKDPETDWPAQSCC